MDGEDDDFRLAAAISASLEESAPEPAEVEAVTRIPATMLPSWGSVLGRQRYFAQQLQIAKSSPGADPDAYAVANIVQRLPLGVADPDTRRWSWRVMLGVRDEDVREEYKSHPVALHNQDQCDADAADVVRRLEACDCAGATVPTPSAVAKAASHIVAARALPYGKGFAHSLVPFLAAGFTLPEAHTCLLALLARKPHLASPAVACCAATPVLAHHFRLLLAFHDPALASALSAASPHWFGPASVPPSAPLLCLAPHAPTRQLLPLWDLWLALDDAAIPLCAMAASLIAHRATLVAADATTPADIGAALADESWTLHPAPQEVTASLARAPAFSLALRTRALWRITPTTFTRDVAGTMREAAAPSPRVRERRLTAFYATHNPTNTRHVRTLLHRYRGREAELEKGAVDRYGVAPDLRSPTDWFAGEAEAAGEVIAGVADLSANADGEGAAQATTGDAPEERPALVPGFRGAVAACTLDSALYDDAVVPGELQRALCLRVDAADVVPTLLAAGGPRSAALAASVALQDEYTTDDEADGADTGEGGGAAAGEGGGGAARADAAWSEAAAWVGASAGAEGAQPADDGSKPLGRLLRPRAPVFLVDCRTEDETAAGAFSTAWPFDPALVTVDAHVRGLLDAVRPLAGAVRIVVLHGLPAPADTPPGQPTRAATAQLEASADLLATAFSRTGFPLVALMRGGFRDAVRLMRTRGVLAALPHYDEARCRAATALRFEALKERDPEKYRALVRAAKAARHASGPARRQAEEERAAARRQAVAAAQARVAGGARRLWSGATALGSTALRRMRADSTATGGGSSDGGVERGGKGDGENSGGPQAAGAEKPPLAQGLSGWARGAGQWVSRGVSALAAKSREDGQRPAPSEDAAPHSAPVQGVFERRHEGAPVRTRVGRAVGGANADSGTGHDDGEDDAAAFLASAGDGDAGLAGFDLDRVLAQGRDALAGGRTGGADDDEDDDAVDLLVTSRGVPNGAGEPSSAETAAVQAEEDDDMDLFFSELEESPATAAPAPVSTANVENGAAVRPAGTAAFSLGDDDDDGDDDFAAFLEDLDAK